MKRMVLLAGLTLAACGPDVPQFDSQIAPPERGASFPVLLPLGPLLTEAEALLPRDAAREGAALEARAADLRRRAALLRAMTI